MQTAKIKIAPFHWEKDLGPESRIWIYLADRKLTDVESQRATDRLRNFASDWTSHNRMLIGDGFVYGNRLFVLAVDESQAGASGCSIDASVRFLRQLADELDIDLFNRRLFAYLDTDGNIVTIGQDGLSEAVRTGAIGPDTLMLDTLVSTRKEFESAFIKPLSDSWHSRFIDR